MNQSQRVTKASLHHTIDYFPKKEWNGVFYSLYISCCCFLGWCLGLSNNMTGCARYSETWIEISFSQSKAMTTPVSTQFLHGYVLTVYSFVLFILLVFLNRLHIIITCNFHAMSMASQFCPDSKETVSDGFLTHANQFPKKVHHRYYVIFILH